MYENKQNHTFSENEKYPSSTTQVERKISLICIVKITIIGLNPSKKGVKRMSMYNKKRELLATKLITPLIPLYEKEFPLLFF